MNYYYSPNENYLGSKLFRVYNQEDGEEVCEAWYVGVWLSCLLSSEFLNNKEGIKQIQEEDLFLYMI